MIKFKRIISVCTLIYLFNVVLFNVFNYLYHYLIAPFGWEIFAYHIYASIAMNALAFLILIFVMLFFSKTDFIRKILHKKSWWKILIISALAFDVASLIIIKSPLIILSIAEIIPSLLSSEEFYLGNYFYVISLLSSVLLIYKFRLIESPQ